MKAPATSDGEVQQRSDDGSPRVVRGALINLLGNLGGAVDPLLMIVVSRLLGAESLGRYVLATTWVAMLMRFVVMGFDRGLLRHVALAEAQADGRTRELSVLGTALRLLLGLSLVATLVGSVLAKTLLISDGEDPSGGGATMLSLLALSLPAQALSTFWLYSLRGRHDMLAHVVVRDSFAPLCTFSVTLAALWLGLGERALVLGYLSAQYLAALFAFLWFRRRFGKLSASSLFSAPHDREFVRFSAPQGVTELLNLLLARVDVLMLAAFFPGDTRLIAVYGVTSTVASFVKRIRQGFDISFSPLLARLIARGDRAALQAAYHDVTRVILMLSLPLSGLLALSAPLLLACVGQEYVVYWPVVPILLAGRFLNAAFGPAQIALLMAGFSRLELINNAAIAALGILGNALLIPRYGVYGAAIATAIAVLVFNLVRMLQVRHYLGLAPDRSNTVRMTLAALLSGCAPVVVVSTWSANPLAHGAATLMFALTYPLALSAVGIRSGLRAFLDALQRRGRQRGGATPAPTQSP